MFKGKILHKTLSACPDCSKILQAQIIEYNSNVYMNYNCPKHGQKQFLYFKDSTLYKIAYTISYKNKQCKVPKCINSVECYNHLKKSTTVLLNVTDKCNLSCPTCLASAGSLNRPEPDLEQIKRAFPKHTKYKKPSVCLIGGEPTLRKDIFKIISLLKNNGYTPRLNTNGLNLEKNEIRNKLKSSGLDWIILQFDGLSESSSYKLRNRKLSKRKINLVKTLIKDGFKVQLAVMTVNGINCDETVDIIKFALDNNIFWVSFYPHTLTGRNNLCNNTTHISDVMDSISIQSNNKITKQDFLNSFKLWSLLYKFFRFEPFRQKVSTFPLILIKDKNNFVPFTRLLGIGPDSSFSPKLLLLNLKSYFRALNYEHGSNFNNLLFISIEKFHDYNTIDLIEASMCHMCYITNKGTVAFDVYNRFLRNYNNW